MPDWGHAPIHRLAEAGAYCVTAGTYLKQRMFHRRRQLDMLQEMFFEAVKRHGWLLHAWCFFPNHYHFVASSDRAITLSTLIGDFHSESARELNRLEGERGRRVWFQYWDTHLTHSGSYLARLRYVHENAVHHKIVTNAKSYQWCSADWFERNASRAFYQAVSSIKIDRVKVVDDFPIWSAAAMPPL